MNTTKDQANRAKLYSVALTYLGIDASPKDAASDEYGCADSVTQVLLAAFPGCIKGSVSTAELYNQLNNSKEFTKVKAFKFGDIIISPTGMGAIGKIPNKITNGHVGIVGEDEEIMSNSSATGFWTQNYNLTSWVARYRTLGGYPIYFFRKV